jgi:hypothetical protein
MHAYFRNKYLAHSDVLAHSREIELAALKKEYDEAIRKVEDSQEIQLAALKKESDMALVKTDSKEKQKSLTIEYDAAVARVKSDTKKKYADLTREYDTLVARVKNNPTTSTKPNTKPATNRAGTVDLPRVGDKKRTTGSRPIDPDRPKSPSDGGVRRFDPRNTPEEAWRSKLWDDYNAQRQIIKKKYETRVNSIGGIKKDPWARGVESRTKETDMQTELNKLEVERKRLLKEGPPKWFLDQLKNNIK